MERLWGILQQLLARFKMRLRASVRRRLALDLLALITGVRAVVLLDYVAYSPKMAQQLCELLFHLSQEVKEVAPLRVLDMEGCGYIVHPLYLLEFMDRSLSSSSQLLFIILDDSSPRKALHAEHETVVKSFAVVQERLSSHLLTQILCGGVPGNKKAVIDASQGASEASAIPAVLTPGCISSGTNLLFPTLNGWLLGYPVVYVFKEERASQAGRCLGSASLHLYQVLVGSTLLDSVASQGSARTTHDEEELLSFSVPSPLSPLGSSEVWVQGYFEGLSESVQRASHVWTSVRLEVTVRKMEAIAL